MTIYENFDHYLYEKISNLQILNVDDVCMAIAISWVFNGEMPENIISKAEMQLILNTHENNEDGIHTDESTLATLKPIHEWLVKHICKAIEEKEIKPLILSLSIQGKVNPSCTYVQDHKISNWLGYRGISGDMFNDMFDYNDYAKYLDSIFESIKDRSYMLSNYINRRSLPLPESEESYVPTYSERSNNYELQKKVEKLERQLKQQDKSSSKYTERFAKNREQVLGAALCVITKWPEQCANNSGKIEATKIANLIDEKSLLFWPQTGEPPLSREKMERELSKWINQIGK